MRMLIRLAEIAQTLAEGCPFQTLHEAIPEIVATVTENGAVISRFRRGRKS